MIDDFKEALEIAQTKSEEDHNALLQEDFQGNSLNDWKAKIGSNSFEAPRLSLPVIEVPEEIAEETEVEAEEADDDQISENAAHPSVEESNNDILKHSKAEESNDSEGTATDDDEIVIKAAPKPRKGKVAAFKRAPPQRYLNAFLTNE